MPGYDVVSAEGAKEGLICPECDLLILREAVQTASGDRLCLDCFENTKQTKRCRSEKTRISLCFPGVVRRKEEGCCSNCLELSRSLISIDVLIMRLAKLISKSINAKLVLLLVYSLATVVALLRALRSGWGPPLELALSLSNDNYWLVFVDVFADLLACVWSNPDTTLYWLLTISLILATLYTAQCYPCNIQYESSTAEASKGCTPIAHRRDLHQSVAREGDWYYLCLSLNLDDSITQPLYNSDVSERVKKRECLDAFYDLGEGEACWETVVRALAGPLINNRRLAKDIAKKYGIDFEKTTNKSEL